MGEYDEQIIFEMGYNSGFKDGIKGSIPKDQYEARLKADMVAMLTEIQLEIEEKEQYYQDNFLESKYALHEAAMGGRMFGCGECVDIIQQKINSLKGENNGGR